MDKKKVINIIKWLAMALLLAGNFFFYRLNGEKINLIMAILVLVYSGFEFFCILTKNKFSIGVKLYLFVFYLFAAIALLTGVTNFMTGNYSILVVMLFIMGGDIALIIYSMHKLSQPLL